MTIKKLLITWLSSLFIFGIKIPMPYSDAIINWKIMSTRKRCAVFHQFIFYNKHKNDDISETLNSKKTYLTFKNFKIQAKQCTCKRYEKKM